MRQSLSLDELHLGRLISFRICRPWSWRLYSQILQAWLLLFAFVFSSLRYILILDVFDLLFSLYSKPGSALLMLLNQFLLPDFNNHIVVEKSPLKTLSWDIDAAYQSEYTYLRRAECRWPSCLCNSSHLSSTSTRIHFWCRPRSCPYRHCQITTYKLHTPISYRYSMLPHNGHYAPLLASTSLVRFLAHSQIYL